MRDWDSDERLVCAGNGRGGRLEIQRGSRRNQGRMKGRQATQSSPRDPRGMRSRNDARSNLEFARGAVPKSEAKSNLESAGDAVAERRGAERLDLRRGAPRVRALVRDDGLGRLLAAGIRVSAGWRDLGPAPRRRTAQQWRIACVCGLRCYFMKLRSIMKLSVLSWEEKWLPGAAPERLESEDVSARDHIEAAAALSTFRLGEHLAVHIEPAAGSGCAAEGVGSYDFDFELAVEGRDEGLGQVLKVRFET